MLGAYFVVCVGFLFGWFLICLFQALIEPSEEWKYRRSYWYPRLFRWSPLESILSDCHDHIYLPLEDKWLLLSFHFSQMTWTRFWFFFPASTELGRRGRKLGRRNVKWREGQIFPFSPSCNHGLKAWNDINWKHTQKAEQLNLCCYNLSWLHRS